MTKAELQKSLEELDSAIFQNDQKSMEIILQKYDLNKILSNESISTARFMKKSSLVMFLCTLAIHNHINEEEAAYWLDIYQSIARKKNTDYIDRLNEKNIIKLAISILTYKIKQTDININEIEASNREYTHAIEILIDNGKSGIAKNLINNLRMKVENSNWQTIINSISKRYPEVVLNNFEERMYSPVFFEIIITGINLENFLERCINSIAVQDYPLYRIHILSDDDPECKIGNADQIKKKFNLNECPVLYCSKFRQGKASIIYEHFHKFEFKDDSVAIILDGDDMFYRKTALTIIANTYAKDSPDVCWSTYIRSDRRLGHSAPLINGFNHRKQGWRSSHCFTFKANLLKKIPREYILGENGEPVMQACDIALALPLLDIAKKTSFIPEALYYYEVSNPQSHHNQEDGVGIESQRQKETAKFLFSKNPLSLNNNQ